jgi:putative ABC transport system permease protein
LGEEILLNGTKFKVVGILEESGSTMGGSNDDIIMIPIKTAQRFLQQSNIATVYIQAAANSVEIAEYQLEQYFLKIFKNEEDAFMIFNQSSLLETINEVTGTMAMMLGGIAAISLIVGGIGIMNIMLVSVTERTREIGIRKAIGAKRSSILKQFLIESAVVSGSGGIIGVIAGIGCSYIFGILMNIPSTTPLYIIIIAFGFSLLVGIFFGIYPANQAAKLKPVDALRYE